MSPSGIELSAMKIDIKGTAMVWIKGGTVDINPGGGSVGGKSATDIPVVEAAADAEEFDGYEGNKTKEERSWMDKAEDAVQEVLDPVREKIDEAKESFSEGDYKDAAGEFAMAVVEMANPRKKIKVAGDVFKGKPSGNNAKEDAIIGSTKRARRNEHLAGKNHPKTGIPFNNKGYPDFSSVSKKNVVIEFTGSRRKDVKAANQIAGYKKTPEGMVWHHHQDGKTMQLVPFEIHLKTGHDGGFSGK